MSTKRLILEVRAAIGVCETSSGFKHWGTCLFSSTQFDIQHSLSGVMYGRYNPDNNNPYVGRTFNKCQLTSSTSSTAQDSGLQSYNDNLRTWYKKLKAGYNPLANLTKADARTFILDFEDDSDLSKSYSKAITHILDGFSQQTGASSEEAQFVGTFLYGSDGAVFLRRVFKSASEPGATLEDKLSAANFAEPIVIPDEIAHIWGDFA